jgi:hypothetical protein
VRAAKIIFLILAVLIIGDSLVNAQLGSGTPIYTQYGEPPVMATRSSTTCFSIDSKGAPTGPTMNFVGTVRVGSVLI